MSEHPIVAPNAVAAVFAWVDAGPGSRFVRFDYGHWCNQDDRWSCLLVVQRRIGWRHTNAGAEEATGMSQEDASAKALAAMGVAWRVPENE